MRRLAWALALVAWVTGPARAAPAQDPAGEPADDERARPWADGVSAEEQATAEALFAEGNELLDQGLFVPALEAYRKAIAHWDHPAIRYNIAVALINLERPLEAYDHLQRALRFGPDALEPDVYKQALAYQRLLEGQVVHLTVECVDADARVSLDGHDLALRCPGRTEATVLAGAHRLFAEKPGYLARTIELALSGGETRRELIDLLSLDEATLTRRRWPRWRPWGVVGLGVAAGAVGLGFELQARATLRSYDDAVAVLCGDQPCDELPMVVSDAYDRGRLQNQIAVGCFVAGAVTTVTGIVLVLMNHDVTERVGYPTVAPLVGRGAAGVTVALSF